MNNTLNTYVSLNQIWYSLGVTDFSFLALLKILFTMFFILITLVTTFFIRLDLIIPIIKYYLSCEMELGLRILSALYSVLSIFISIVSIKNFISLTVLKFIIKKKNWKQNILFIYIFFYIFHLLTLYFTLLIINLYYP